MDSKEDEEITVDFGKIKNFFKREKKETAEEKKEDTSAEKKEDEELDFSFDLGKVKKFFKSESGKEKAGEEEIPVNWGRVIDFFKKYGVVFIAIIPIILAIYVRMQASFLPITDEWAKSTVINNIGSQIKGAIDQQYPNLPDANKNALVDAELQKVIIQNKRQIDEQIRATSNYFKLFFQDESGKKYMPDIDPYYWYRYAKNIVNHGHPGDVLKEGKPFDTYQLAPLGRFVFPDMFHAYFSAYFYNALHFLIPNLTLLRSMFYTTVFFSALCVLLVFLIGRKIAGNLGGFFAGMVMAINGAFLSRTLHPDNDIWVIFFPLIVTWLFVTTMEVKNTLKIVILTLIAGFFTGLFPTAWSGWWYIFDFVLATVVITFFYLILIKFEDIRKNANLIFSDSALRSILIIGLVYFISTAVFVTLFSGWASFKNSFLGPLSFSSIKAPVHFTLWPNVLTTVAELNEGSVNGIINSVGGPFLFFISLIGLVLSIKRSGEIKKLDIVYIILTTLFYGILFVRLGNLPALYNTMNIFMLSIWLMLPIILRIGISIYKKDASYDFKLPILLSLWVVSTIFASIKGIRFTLLLAPAFSVAFGVALGKFYVYFSQWLNKELKIHKFIASSILIILIIWVFYVTPTRAAISSAGADLPIINDAWYNALIAINKNSSKNAIITSWWDFGHHFKAIADRPVTFDGTTQIFPPAHWVGKLLMTDNERQAVGILRMLDCGSNDAFETLFAINKDTHKSLKILNEIILLEKEDAKNKLRQYKFDDKQIEKVLSYTHCNPPEAFFIASEDMVGKSGVWSHFGSWNFERADLWYNAKRMPQEDAIEYMMQKFNYSKEKAENIYYELQSISSDSEGNTWVAPWPGYAASISCSKGSKEIYLCGNGLQVNLSNYDIFGLSQQGVVRPRAVAFTTEGGVLKKEFNGSTADFGVTVVPKGENELELVLSSGELTGSIFTRMFYMEGHSLRYFKLFNHQRGLTGTDIFVYKVDWEGKDITINQNLVDYLKKPVKKELEESSTKNLTESSNITDNS
ncbi:hypothetical protein HYX02_01320 [Candidatus Woesearchaeota archaeon]|nr:hypothetical protein [Candidatus Woesearchaeota archaeon]